MRNIYPETSNKLSDEELIRRIRDGDRESLGILVKAYFSKIHNRVYQLIPELDADDVIQDIFMGLLDSLDSFEGRSAFTTWFYRIAMNKIADYHRRLSRRKENFNEEGTHKSFNPWEETDEMLMIENALADLPSKYKEILILKCSEGLSFVEIAQKLGLTYEAARSRYRRAITMVRKKIKLNNFGSKKAVNM